MSEESDCMVIFSCTKQYTCLTRISVYPCSNINQAQIHRMAILRQKNYSRSNERRP